MVRHDLYTCEEPGIMPTYTINDNGTLHMDSGKVLNSDFIYNTYLKNMVETAKKYNVGFVLSEVGTDTHDLSKAEYTAYESAWLTVLKQNKIPWTYNYLHGVLAPKGSVQTDCQYHCGFTEIGQVANTHFEMNVGIFKLLKQFQ